jgi:hypothetical protein
MLYIDSAPPKSVDRTYIYETVTILRSEGLVNLEAAATSLTAAFRQPLPSPNTPIAIKPGP